MGPEDWEWHPTSSPRWGHLSVLYKSKDPPENPLWTFRGGLSSRWVGVWGDGLLPREAGLGDREVLQSMGVILRLSASSGHQNDHILSREELKGKLSFTAAGGTRGGGISKVERASWGLQRDCPRQGGAHKRNKSSYTGS